MEKWKIFEEEASKYLNQTIKVENLEFKPSGGEDSTKSDIDVLYKGRSLFVIEAKLSPAQAGQFVVHFENGAFKFSDKNKQKRNEYSKRIIGHMNNNTSKYKNYGTKGLEIACKKSDSINWIISHYKPKKAKFVITSTSFRDFNQSFIKVLKLEDFGDNFDVTAIYRIKKSGSSKMPQKDESKVRGLLIAKFGKAFSLDKDGNVRFHNLNPKKQKLNGAFYLSSKEGDYKIKKLSNTFNANVIFTAKFIGKKRTGGFDILEKEIKRLIS